MNISPDITVMLEAVRKAAQGIIRDFGEVGYLQASRKGTADFVTKTDINAEERIYKILSKARPDYGFLLEEGGEIEGKNPQYRWVVDPLDGTNNFIHAIPYFCSSIALEKRRRHDGKWDTQAAVVYDPLRDEAFYAEKNKGAFCNERRIKISCRNKLEEALLVTHSPKHDKYHFEKSMQLLNTVTRRSKGARTMGATALDLAYIAAGRFDVGWYTAFRQWDIAAGTLLVREAGGEATQLNGDADIAEPESLLLGTSELHAVILKLLKPVWLEL